MTNTTSTKSTAPVKEATQQAAAEAKAERVIKAGGEKGQRILNVMKDHPEFTRAQVAEAAEATVGRVGEVFRWSRDNGTKEEKAVVAAHIKAQEAKKAEKAKAAAAAKAEKEAARKAAAKEKADKAAAAKKESAGKAPAKPSASTAKASAPKSAAPKAS